MSTAQVDANGSGPGSSVAAPVFAVENLSAGYGGVPVVRDLTLHVNSGEVVALLGANGAGKSTTILTLAGELKPLSGRVFWSGEEVDSPLFKRAKSGLRLITEERSVFMTLTVAENLRLSYRDYEACLEMFPELKPLLRRKAGLLSGGEQQMLTLARALAGNARGLLADELSLGLAPLASERLLSAIRSAAKSGMAVLLVEQHLERVLKVADRAYVFQRGRIVMEGDCEYIASHKEEVIASYLS
jgi:branched-chain amino acid transport system ATP-binding protein